MNAHITVTQLNRLNGNTPIIIISPAGMIRFNRVAQRAFDLSKYIFWDVRDKKLILLPGDEETIATMLGDELDKDVIDPSCYIDQLYRVGTAYIGYNGQLTGHVRKWFEQHALLPSLNEMKKEKNNRYFYLEHTGETYKGKLLSHYFVYPLIELCHGTRTKEFEIERKERAA